MNSHVLSVFAVQSFVTTIVIIFCIGMLARGADPGVYLPVLTGIAGFWFPSPLQHTLTHPSETQSFTQILSPSELSPEVRIVSDPISVQVGITTPDHVV